MQKHLYETVANLTLNILGGGGAKGALNVVENVGVVLCWRAPIFGDMSCHHCRCHDLSQACLLMYRQHDHAMSH